MEPRYVPVFTRDGLGVDPASPYPVSTPSPPPSGTLAAGLSSEDQGSRVADLGRLYQPSIQQGDPSAHTAQVDSYHQDQGNVRWNHGQESSHHHLFAASHDAQDTAHATEAPRDSQDDYDPYQVFEAPPSSAGDPNAPPPRPRGLVRLLWAWELAASVLSLAAIASIALVASYEQGKPLDEWRRGLGTTVSPTAVVAFLSTIGKSACLVALSATVSQLKWMHFGSQPRVLSDLHLFDEASRGPWGAFLLMLYRSKAALLASGASALILASLVLDPFVQLIFDFPSELRPAPGSLPEIQASQTYDPFHLPLRYRQCYGPSQVDTVMQAAVLSPVWNATRAPSLPCSFERCEWPTFTTLGVCSRCVDYTDDVAAECKLTPFKAGDFTCNYTITAINAAFGATFAVTGGASVRTPYHTVWSSTASRIEAPGDSPGSAPLGGSPELGRFAFIQLDQDLPWQKDSLDFGKGTLKANPPIRQAMQCTLSLCARTFETPFFTNFTAGPLSGRETPLVTDKLPYGGSAVEMLSLKPAAEPGHPDMDAAFAINYCEYTDLVDYMRTLLSTYYLTAGMGMKDAPCPDSDSDWVGLGVTPNIGLALSQTANVSVLMQSMAASMTEAFRTSANSTAVRGVGLNTVAYISIDWAWLSLPVAVVTLAFVMLVVAMVRSQARGVPAWKSSSLALVFHELQGWEQEKTAGLGLHGLDDVERRAAGMTARAVHEGGELLFSRG